MSDFSKVPLSSKFWLVVWAGALSWCWLLPNHYLPWSGFHMEAWAAAVLLPMAAAVIWRTRRENHVPISGLLVLGVSALPLAQQLFGIIPLIGPAWVAFSYLLGLALAIFVGQRWEQQSPAQLGDGLFLAIGIAAMASVGLQLHQWLQLDLMEIWLMGNGYGRPFANFGQPNQLGTLLLWGILALAWGTLRAQIRPCVMVVATVFLLFGLALTASRTAWVGVGLLVLAAWYWRKLWPWRSTPWVATALAISFFIFAWIIPILTIGLQLSSAEGEMEALARISSNVRPQIWILFMDAIRQSPWFGYGWNQVIAAQLAVGIDRPPLGSLFGSAHNLLLDLMLWCGIPFGLAIISFGVLWLWRRFQTISDSASALLFLLIVVVGNHAMLEYPLQYAYFLLPTGLVAGSLDARLRGRMLAFGHRWLLVVIWVASAVLLTLLVRDYSRVETSYQLLRFEWAKIPLAGPRQPPEVLLLDHLGAAIANARFEPTERMSPAQLDRMRHVASLYPSAGVIHKLAAALAWNKQPEEAALWLRRLCAVNTPDQCQLIKNAWAKQAESDPRIAAVPWAK